MNNDVHQKDSVDKMHISISSFKLKAFPAFAVFLLLFYAVVIFYAFVFAADSNVKVDFSFWIALIFFLAFPLAFYRF